MSDFLQLLLAGVSLGAIYALVSIGFVTIYKATGVINFAQGGFVALGAFVAHELREVRDLPFAVSVVGAMMAMALLGALLERAVLRPLVGKPVFAVTMVSLGLLILLEQAGSALWGYDPVLLGDPWGISTVALGTVLAKVADLWTIGAAAVVLAALWAYFTYSVRGVAMRATANDPEAALAQGIGAGAVYGVAWALAAAIAALAGVLLASGGKGVDLTLSAIALKAFPAMILGGLDSPSGAVAGGVIIGVTEVLAAGYLTANAPWLGANVHAVAPYVVMLLVLLVRPYGLAGTPEVRRV
jgi:branched-chain amino acid transport system permease protein